MADSGIKSKRRWAQWLGYAGTLIGAVVAIVPTVAPAAVAVFPEYAKGIQLGALVLTGLSSELARRSKNADTQAAENSAEVGSSDA